MLNSTIDCFARKAAEMPLVPTSVRAVWKSAELMIAFHKNKNKQRRDAPYLSLYLN